MKARGRPRLAADDASVNVHFRLPSKQYDLSQKQADQARLPIAEPKGMMSLSWNSKP